MEAVNQGFLTTDGQPAEDPSAQARWSELLVAADEAIAGGRLAEARDLFKESLRTAQETWPGDARLAESYVRLADVCAALDRGDVALRLYGQGVTVLGGLADGVGAGLAHAVSNMGRLHMLNGDMDKAGELTAAGDALQRKLEEPNSPAIKLNLAIVAAAAQRDRDAGQAFEEAVAAADRSRARIGALGMAVLDNYARYCIGGGRSEEAQMALRRCLILRQEAGGPRNPVYAEGLVNLARLLQDCNGEEEAETLLWQAVEVYRRNGDQPVAGLVSTTWLLARIAQRSARTDEAETLCESLTVLGEANPPAAAAAEAAALHVRANLLLAGGDSASAESPMRRALSLANSLSGEFRRLGDDIAGDLLYELAGLLAEIGKGAEAERLTARAGDLRQRPQWKLTGFVFAPP